MIVDCAHYKHGARQDAGPTSIADAASCASSGDGFVRLGIHDPTDEEIREIAAASRYTISPSRTRGTVSVPDLATHAVAFTREPAMFNAAGFFDTPVNADVV
jgi:hypothetical protein